MKEIVLASNNKHKIKEVNEILKGYKVVSMEEIGYKDDIVEDGETFSENALIKAKTISEYLKSINKELDVIAEDSGLCCDGLDGAPGIYSARYAGNHDDQANRDKLRKELKGKDKRAYFICCLILYHPDGTYKEFVGKTEGTIIDEEKGKLDFGYDPIFLSKDLNKTFGEATEEEKNSVSHRGRALELLLKELGD